MPILWTLSSYHPLWIIPLAIVSFITFYVYLVTKHRQDPFEEAVFVKASRWKSGRMERHPKLDLYLPPTMNGVVPALLFLPGALISHTAYSVISSKLSDAGILVIVVNLEPTRLAAPLFFSKRHFETIMDEVKARFQSHTLEWVIGGHSMGASFAASQCRNLCISKCVLWGSNTGLGLEQSVEILSCNGTNDEIIGGTTKTIPAHAQRVYIQGGNHSGFAHYGPQRFPKIDGERMISLEEQQDAVVRATAMFLLGSQKQS
jgi:hypothetical protein